MGMGGKPNDVLAADLWSCAMVLYLMLFGVHPYINIRDNVNERAVPAQIMFGNRTGVLVRVYAFSVDALCVCVCVCVNIVDCAHIA